MAMRRYRNGACMLTIVVWLASMSSAGGQAPQAQPKDSTVLENAAQEPTVGDSDVEKDDPISRLKWQRGAWGLVTPTFRQNAIKQGKDHSDKKNARGPKWVNIGPIGSEYEQNGSFTGHVRDSGRARTILPHPTNPDIVYFLTSGGGLWRTDNWNSPKTNGRALTDDLPTTGGGSVAVGSKPTTLYPSRGHF